MAARIGLLTLAGVIAAGAAVLWFSGSAGAIHDVVIEYTRVDGPPGAVIEIANEEVEPEFQGTSCGIRVEVENNASAHSGTDILLTSGGETLTISDVETMPGTIFIGEGELVLGETVVAAVRLGPDGISSGGFFLHFECELQPPPTTTIAPTTTQPPGTTLPPTTTEPPPPTVSPQTTLPPTQPEPPTAAQPTFTG
ncbi:MAG: hypothetical protein ACR2QE_09280 [Acidimicrobiales bacterium]